MGGPAASIRVRPRRLLDLEFHQSASDQSYRRATVSARPAAGQPRGPCRPAGGQLKPRPSIRKRFARFGLNFAAGNARSHARYGARRHSDLCRPPVPNQRSLRSSLRSLQRLHDGCQLAGSPNSPGSPICDLVNAGRGPNDVTALAQGAKRVAGEVGLCRHGPATAVAALRRQTTASARSNSTEGKFRDTGPCSLAEPRRASDCRRLSRRSRSNAPCDLCVTIGMDRPPVPLASLNRPAAFGP